MWDLKESICICYCTCNFALIEYIYKIAKAQIKLYNYDLYVLFCQRFTTKPLCTNIHVKNSVLNSLNNVFVKYNPKWVFIKLSFYKHIKRKRLSKSILKISPIVFLKTDSNLCIWKDQGQTLGFHNETKNYLYIS